MIEVSPVTIKRIQHSNCRIAELDGSDTFSEKEAQAMQCISELNPLTLSSACSISPVPLPDQKSAL